jgi:FAD/FMN-containing dehydrogenase/ketosteroid isomerase-like protein
MTADHTPTLDVVRDVYQAVGQGDIDRAVAAFDDDIEWVEPEGGPFGGTYHGPEAVVENVFSSLGEEWDEFVVEPDRFVVDDETVVAFVTHRGTHATTNEHFEAPIADVWDLSDGKVTRFQHYIGSISYVEMRESRETVAPSATAVTGIERTLIDDFGETLRGDLIEPGDSEFDEARTVYNSMIDKHPGLIAQCSNVADVVSAVNFGREHELDVAIRSGGHNGPGLALVDDGLVIDLSEMTGIRVDPGAKTVQVEAGCTWGDVDHATHSFGLATVSGIISTTGVGGLTLGGGHGYLSRKYGLTVDNLLSADVVLADGSFVRASETENEDLFWALRGGGGNFGVVTSFEFQLHPVDTVYGGPIIWPVNQAEEIIRWYRDFIRDAPEDLFGWFGFHQVPEGAPLPEELHGEQGCVTTWCYTGPMDEAEDIFEPIREVGTPALDMIQPIPYPALQSMFDEMYYPPGLQWYWKGDFVKELTDEAIDEHLKYGRNLPTPLSTMHLYPIDGAVHRVGVDETAWRYRDATWSMVIAGVASDPTNTEEITDWAQEYWEALHPHSEEGGYINFMMEEGEDRIRATYGDNYERLQRVKSEYDPENLFHVNQNIEPVA